MTLAPMENRLPTGPGSRGGTIHLPGMRNRYDRAWRAGNPEYRAREALRRSNARAAARGDIAPSRLTTGRFPEPAVTCVCACGCRESVVVFCGFCRDGMHGEAEALS